MPQCVVQCLLDAIVGCHRAQIAQCPGDIRDGDLVDDREVVRVEHRCPVDYELRWSGATSAGHREVQLTLLEAVESMQRRG